MTDPWDPSPKLRAMVVRSIANCVELLEKDYPVEKKQKS